MIEDWYRCRHRIPICNYSISTGAILLCSRTCRNQTEVRGLVRELGAVILVSSEIALTPLAIRNPKACLRQPSGRIQGSRLLCTQYEPTSLATRVGHQKHC
jgi:hypothetical protein